MYLGSIVGSKSAKLKMHYRYSYIFMPPLIFSYILKQGIKVVALGYTKMNNGKSF